MFVQYFVVADSVEKNTQGYKNSFSKIFDKENVKSLKKNIINYCKQENISIEIKKNDDEILEILSIFTNEKFKKINLQSRLEIQDMVILMIYSSLIFIETKGLKNKIINLYNRFITWICRRPNIHVQKSVEYISKMIKFLLTQSNNFKNLEEFELCYLAILKYFTQVSLQYGNPELNEAYYQTKEENFQYYINFLIKDKTIEMLGKYCISLQNNTTNNYVPYQFIPIFCKNILYPSNGYFEFLKKYSNILFDSKKNTILPFGMVIRWSFYVAKTNDIYLFEFLKKQYYNEHYLNFSNSKKENFHLFLRSIGDLLEDN